MVYNYSNMGIKICIDKRENGHVSGKVCSPMLSAPILFTDLGNLVIQLDEFLDVVGFPCAFQKLRSFLPEGSRIRRFGNFSITAEPRSIEGDKGELLTLGLRITSRQNASWQGIVEYGGKKTRFRSALELLKMMYPLIPAKTDAA